MDAVVETMVSKNVPRCPHCKKELPVPGIVGYRYRCGGCGGFYSVNMELVRIFTTELWSNEKNGN